MFKTFGQRLKELRAETGLTQDQLSEQLGIPKNTLARYEADIRLPTTKYAYMLARYFGISMNELFDEDAYNRPTPPKKISEIDIRFSLSTGEKVITSSQFKEIKQFARFIQMRDDPRSELHKSIKKEQNGTAQDTTPEAT